MIKIFMNYYHLFAKFGLNESGEFQQDNRNRKVIYLITNDNNVDSFSGTLKGPTSWICYNIDWTTYRH